MQDIKQPENLTGDAAEFAAATAYIPEALSGAPGGAEGQAEAPVAIQPEGISLQMMATIVGLPFQAMTMLMGEGAEFWLLSDLEKSNLANVWHGLLNPIWIKWAGEQGGPWILAAMMTAVTVGPRLVRENARRASLTGSMETASAGASPSSQAQPVQASQQRQTDLSFMREEL